MYKVLIYSEGLHKWTDDFVNSESAVEPTEEKADAAARDLERIWPGSKFCSERIPPKLELIAEDRNGDRESWHKAWVFKWSVTKPDLKTHEEDEGVIHNACCKGDVCISSQGNGCPGHAFANEPYINVYDNGLLIVEQSGGLDV